jgi:electron transport complex protein RnfG
MKQMVKIGITLALIASVAATTLAVVNAVTAPRIAIYEAKVIEEALQTVAGPYEIGESRESDDSSITSLYHLLDSNRNEVGYIVQLTGVGYGGEMTMMVSYLSDGEVLDARLLANSETPGLGKKAEEAVYMEKFIATGGANSVPQSKGELSKEEADSISGSTVTFAGVAKTVAYGSDFVKSLGGK